VGFKQETGLKQYWIRWHSKNIQEQIDSFSEYSLPTNFTYNATTDTWSYLGTDLYRTTGLSLLNAQGKKRILRKLQRIWIKQLD
jgi:hypothetical protein